MRKSYVFLLLLLILLFTACGNPASAPAPSPETPAAADPVPPSPTVPPTPEPVLVVLTRSDGSELILPEESTEITVDDIALLNGLFLNASSLTSLRSIDLTDALAFTAEDVAALQTAFPDAEVRYRIIINGVQVDPAAVSLDLSTLSADSVPDTARELGKLSSLQRISLTSASSPLQDVSEYAEEGSRLLLNGNLSPEDIHTLKDACPNAVFDCSFLLYGKKVSTADTHLEYTDIKITDEGVNTVFRRILPAMGELQYLKLDRCEVTSPVMAQLRQEFPDIKIVWRVYFSGYGQTADGSYAVYNCLTDTEKVWATGCVTDLYATELQYCTDVKYLDLGHNCITNIDFVRNMPNLEVAVLSVSWLESLEPLSSCEKLIYLECFSTNITDLSPLASCINLKYLNIGSPRAARPFTDLSPLYDLDLKRLYCTSSPIPKDQQEEFMSLHPDCECEFGMVDPSKGYWRFVDGNPANTDPSNRNEVYAWLFEVFGYENLSNQSK